MFFKLSSEPKWEIEQNFVFFFRLEETIEAKWGQKFASELVTINWNSSDFYVKHSTITLKHLFLMAGWPDLQDTLASQEV